MIVLLEKNSLKAKDKFLADKMSLNLSERASTATLTVGPQAPQLTVGDWVMDEEEPGKGIVWRVKTIDQQFETLVRTIQLEHAINTLRDTVMFGDISTKTLANDKKATTCTAAKALQYVINKQSVWKLGTVDYTVSQPYNFNSDDVYSAVETISSTLEDCQWTYDFSSYPFTLSIKKPETAFSCEMRVDRNLRTLKRTTDRSRMYTRIYPIGQNDIRISGNYLSKNESFYGTISKVQTNNDIKTRDELKTWAQHLLNRHCEPLVTVTISGLEFFRTTGEALDRLAIGKVCRVPIPELETTITERITKLSWADKVNSPEEVTVTLANELEDVTSIIGNIAKASSGKGKAKKDGEDHAWFVDTDTHVGMVAEALAGEGADKDWSRVSSIMVDGLGITSQVQVVKEGVVNAQSSITQHEDFIDATVKAIGKNGKVSAASIVASVNASGSKVRISADKIELDGDVLLNDVLKVMSKQATFLYPVGFKNGASGKVTVGIVPKDGAVAASSFSWNKANSPTVKVDYDTLQDMVKKAELVGTSSLKLTLFNGDTINFSKAVTSISGSWSGGTLTLVPLPQGSPSYKVRVHTPGADVDTCIDIEKSGSPSIQPGSDNKWIQTDIQFVSRNASGTPTDRGDTFTLGVNATLVHTAGRNAVNITGPTWSPAASSSPSSNHNEVSFSTDAPTSKSGSADLYIYANGWSSGSNVIYMSHTDTTTAANRLAKLSISVPSTTVKDKIATYGNTYPDSIDGGNISKSGITVGKYMTMTVRTGGKDTTVRFHVVS